MIVYFFIVLAVVLVLGNAMILLRTAKKPRIPDRLTPEPIDREEGSD